MHTDHFFFRFLFSSVLCFLPVLNVFADWNNFIINYNKSLYGKGSQTWQIGSYGEGWAYFANQNGMLQYDGNSWRLFPLNNDSDVRSVLPSGTQKRIYAGGIGEFGYFVPGPNGQLLYHCLSDSISAEERAIGNVWGIHEADNIVYFQGDNRVVKYLNGKFTTIDAGCKIDCSGMVKDVLYVGTDNGVKALVGHTFFLLRGSEPLVTKRIRGVIPHAAGGVVVVTAYDGLFHCDGERCVPLETGVERFLSENEVFCVADSGDLIALGTVHRGIVLVNRSTGEVKYFNENNGLQNNTVLSLAFDLHGNLWAGMDSGIDYVCLSSSLTSLYTYPYSFGTGYDAVPAGGYLYLGTNRGLFYTKYPVAMSADRSEIHPVPSGSGQVWSLQKIGDQLFCMHDRGMFLVEGLSLKRIGQISGTWACRLVDGTGDKMYVGVYDGLYLLQKKAGEWNVAHRIGGISDSFRFFEQESAQVLWMSDQNRCMRVELDSTLTRVVKQTFFDERDGLPSGKKIRINRIGNRVYFSALDGIYEYNYHTGRMERSEEINRRLNGTNPYYSIKEYNGHLIGLNRHEVCISNLVTYKRGASTCILPLDMSTVELVRGAETLAPLSDSLIVIPNDNGFALARIPSQKLRKDYSRAVHIRNVFISYPKDSLIYTDNFLSRKNSPEIPYSRNTVRFEYGITSFTHGEDVSYQYRLDDGGWSGFTKSTLKEYSSLAEGSHTFRVKAVFADAMSATDSFTFRILPPWYRSHAAYLCYLLALAALMWYIYKWDDVRVKRKKQQAIVEKDKELHEKEKEFERENARKERQIIQLEKEKLEHDLRYKSQEMANLMINVVRKNEILTEIKSDLFKVMSKAKEGSGKEIKQLLLIVSNKIDSNIKSDDVLKRIEEQFDLVHNNFMKHLQERHPDLSLNERMMCAYIKMDLSSKEIAPLLNISVRGVETVRYRIRKKLLLDREASLTDYLNSGF
ncbi:MAG: transcriptional regulator [Mediterranea sp.]|jgi:DNA-binding CsgD family transcriptional regulator|nr:transcriptional regulator [Mediterranea sp.]